MAKDIKHINVNFHEEPENSFSIENDNNQFILKDALTQEVVPNVDTTKLKRYVSLYENIYYEMIILDATKNRKDSILGAPPYFSIEVETFVGTKNKIVAYHMPNYRQIMKPNEEPYEYDVDRMYAYLNDDLFIYIQFPTFDKITLPKDFFTKE